MELSQCSILDNKDPQKEFTFLLFPNTPPNKKRINKLAFFFFFSIPKIIIFVLFLFKIPL